MHVRSPLLLTGLMLTMVLGARAVPAANFGDPLPGLSAADTNRFFVGQGDFLHVEGIADGLGPVFNDSSCAACHSSPATGGGSTRIETRFGKRVNGVFDPLAGEGGTGMQSQGLGDLGGGCVFTGEVVPADANVVAGRRTQPLFGLGLVDSIPDDWLRFVAQLEAWRDRSTAGRPNMVTDVSTGKLAVGRFGWKAQDASLMQFSGDAYLNEMGITSPMFPNENCPQGNCSLLACNPAPGLNNDGSAVVAFADFMTLLGPPPRGPVGAAETAGNQIFTQIGCDNCHTSTLISGQSAVPALRFKVFHPFSDFLLHDMGSLGDGIEQGQAKGSEMRTAPLWGLSQFTLFLHDGRATNVTDAILAHDGQGKAARDRFAALSATQKQKLIAFLMSL